jgi:hypothetical protein
VKTTLALKKTLTQCPTEFARGRAAHAALAPFATPEALLGALDLASITSHAERDAITLALVTEHQRTSRPLWQSLLLVAYEPMLANVWRRLYDKRDAEPRIVLAFLEAIAKVSLAHPPALLALHLKQATERGAFGSTAASREEPELVPLADARKERAHESPEARVVFEDEKRRLMAELSQLFADEAPAVLDVLVRARTGREPLVALVAEKYPELTSKQRAVAYQRLQRLRRRALTHLGTRFASCAA